MTTREKTVEFPFDFDANVVAATTFRTFGPITLSLPENSARVIKSVYVECTVSSNRTTTATNATAPVVGVQLAAVAFADTTMNIDSNGWNYNSMSQHQFIVDLTSYFVTNLGSGTTQTCSVRMKFPESTVNCSAKLVVTYYYEDTDATHVKTARIPLAGGTIALGTSLASIGSSTEVPLLNTFLPEASKTYKFIWFETVMTCKDPAATFTVGLALDAAASSDDGTHQTGGNATGDIAGYRRIFTQNSMTTSAAHDFKAKASVANAVYDICVNLCVTYTFDPAATTRVLLSLELPAITEGPLPEYLNLTTATRLHRDRFVFNIQGANPTLVQSGVRWTMRENDGGSFNTPQFRVGTQTYGTYATPMSVSFVQQYNSSYVQQRCDSGATQGAGFTIARGQNIVFADYYVNIADTVDVDYGIHTPVLYLNVVVDKPAAGVGVLEKTIKYLLFASTFPQYFNGTYTTNQMYLTSMAPVIPEAAWAFVGGFGFKSFIGVQIPALFASLKSGELGASMDGGWVFVDQPCDGYEGLGEEYTTASLKKWTRFANDLDTERMNPFTARSYSLSAYNSNVGQTDAYVWMFSYHSITYTVAGTVTGYSGAGSGITVDVHRSDTGERVATTTTATGGTYSVTVYDNTLSYYAEAYQDATHLGRSANQTPV